jgi:hypothetical protein
MQRKTVREIIGNQPNTTNIQVVAHQTVRYNTPDGATRYRYHNTDVFVFAPTSTGRLYHLDSDGYRTPTTKKRINTYLREYALPFSLFQQSYTWYLLHGITGEIHPYYDGITITHNLTTGDYTID